MCFRPTLTRSVIVAVLFVAAAPLFAWTSKGHRRISAVAVEILGEGSIPLARSDWAQMVEASVQPDLMRPRELTQLRDREAPEHYLDWELLQSRRLPPTRSEYIKLLANIVREPGSPVSREWTMETFGTLPYAVVEGTQRLAVAFAQLRQQSDDPALRSMAMYLAGVVAHYAQDLCQPLHTTVDYDGRANRDGSSPQSGIHEVIDGSLRYVALDPKVIGERRSTSFPDLFAAVVEQMGKSHDLVDRVYALEPDLWELKKTGSSSSALEEFVQGRFLHAATFTADLIHTAWILSSEVRMPPWWGDDRSPEPAP